MPSFLRHLSLRARIVAVVGALFALEAALLVFALPSFLEERQRRQAETRAVGLATILAVGLEAPLDFESESDAKTQLGTLRVVPDAVYAQVFGSDGTLIASRGATGPGLLMPHMGSPSTRFTQDALLVQVPIMTRTAGVGTLLVGFSLADLEAHRSATLRTVAQFSLGVFALGLAAAFAIGTVLVRPIRQVTAVAQAIARGDAAASRELVLGRRDEVGQMSSALDQMLKRLYAQTAQLETQDESLRALNTQLETRVADRTLALARANEQLEARLLELHSTQEQLIVADRRVSIGRLAAGVAHEINNPLAYVIGNLRFIADEFGQLRTALRAQPPAEAPDALLDESLGEVSVALDETRQGADRVKHIVQSLKTLSRGDDDRREAVDIHRCLDSAVSMAANEIRHRARLTLDFRTVPAVDANEVRLGQVFLNLLMNAAHAVEVGRVEENEIRVTAKTDTSGRVVVEISDTGCGITPEVLGRLFEPFFTTKPIGVGTGLGLSVSRGIVSALGGSISVESEPGRGSVFRVVLPPASGAAKAANPAASEVPAARRARVLVVDDEPMVGVALKRNLGRDHEVLLATSGAQALEHIAGGEPFDLILCDLMMPGMTGMELSDTLDQRHPAAARALMFMTGGAFTAAAKAFSEANAARQLDKPIDFDRVRAVLRERVEQRQAAGSFALHA
jgi:signal transduction histidine kinase/ActR/RegA family two-component response regulator